MWELSCKILYCENISICVAMSLSGIPSLMKGYLLVSGQLHGLFMILNKIFWSNLKVNNMHRLEHINFILWY